MPEASDDREERRLAELRRQMIEDQFLRRGIRDTKVIDAMLQVPREEFVPKDLREEAYEDYPLSIGYGQTISQPFTVGYMLQELNLAGDEKVLEIGTGSGYAAAVLSRIVREVHTVERISPLAEAARSRLLRLGYENVHVHLGDGTLGCPEQAPFDAIVVAAGAERLPEVYAEQLFEKGRILIPIGGPSSQSLLRFTKVSGQLISENLGKFVFVPLIGS